MIGAGIDTAARGRGPRRWGLAGALVLTLCACDDFPKDIAGTMNEVTSSGVLHAGIVAGGPAEAEERALARVIAKAAGAEAKMQSSSAEVLLHRLEDGELDVVLGEFAKASPWSKRVALTPAHASRSNPAKDEPVLRAAVRSGENRWLLFVNETIREEV